MASSVRSVADHNIALLRSRSRARDSRAYRPARPSTMVGGRQGVRPAASNEGGQVSERRILVTGGPDFSAPICATAGRARDEILCVDNFYTGTRRNVRHLCQPAVRTRPARICFPLYVEVDEIFNLACPAPHPLSARPVQTPRPASTAPSPCWGPPAPQARILQARHPSLWQSSIHPQTEQYWGNVNHRPASCYDEGQALRETLFSTSPSAPACASKVARIFNTYGRHAADDDAWCRTSSSSRCAGGHHRLRRRAQTRSFCYVDDLVDGLVR